jgi:Zn-dependent metalloprotease
MADGGDDDTRSRARETLEEMHLIAQKREHTLIDQTMTGPASGSRLRNVYDARHQSTLPGKLVRSENDPQSSDVEVNEAFDGSGVTLDLYDRIFSRSSIDGKGMAVNASVHYGTRFDNAMWNGEQMVYGDGDGKLFNRFTASIDVIGHELTHGVTQYTAALEYSGQTGALNEHISDAFGIMVKQYALGQTAKQSDWLIGAALLAKGVKGKAIRSMAAPGTAYDDPRLGRDPQPARMQDYVVTSDDGGGIHINSGIPNHAFYLAAIEIGGNTWTALGKIWYATLTTRLKATSMFRDFANATFSVAGKLYGTGSRVQSAVGNAWSKVGVAPRARSARRSVKWRLSTRTQSTTTTRQKKGDSK